MIASASNAASAAAAIFTIGPLLLFFIAVLVGIYFVPTIIAFAKKKTNKIAILALNALLGWSLIGWVVSLVWALANEELPATIVIQQASQQAPSSPSDT